MRGLWESLGGLNGRTENGDASAKHALGPKDDAKWSLDENRLRKDRARPSANGWDWQVPKYTALDDGPIGAFVGATNGPVTGYTHMLTSRCGLLDIIMRGCLSNVRPISESDEAEITPCVRTPPREIHPYPISGLVRKPVAYEIGHGLIIYFG